MTAMGGSSCPESPFWEQQGMWPLTQGRQSPLFPGTAVAHRILGGIRNQGAGSILGKPPPGQPGLGSGPAHRTQHRRPVSVCDPPPCHAGGTSVSATATAGAEGRGT